MYSDRIMALTLTIKCMKRDVSITYIYSIERVAHLGRLALFLNRTDFCSFLSKQSRSDYQKPDRFCPPSMNETTYKQQMI